MASLSPVKMMLIGTGMMLLGVILPLLMVLQVIQSSFLLAVISYGASLMGMFLAFFGLFNYVRISRE